MSPLRAPVRHIHWFTYQHRDLPSVRYRAVHPLRHLWDWHGVGSTLVVPGRTPQFVAAFLRAWLRALLHPGKGSVIVVQRVHSFGPYAFALWLLTFLRGDRCIYDIDDAEYIERPSASIKALMRSCALVTTGSDCLMRYARRFNPNTVLLTSPVPDHGCSKALRDRMPRRNDVFTIGWVGCFWGTHEANLEHLVYPALHDLGFRARLVVLGARGGLAEQRLRSRFRGDPWLTIEVDHDVPWCDESAVHARIATFDVGLAPLLDTEINRCKSAFKLKQYMSCGVPVLTSPIGENLRFLRHGVNGLLCADAAAFRAGIYRMAGMADEDHARMSRAASASVADFDLAHYTEAFLKACRRLPAFSREARATARPTTRDRSAKRDGDPVS